jgi:hypothetical protein
VSRARRPSASGSGSRSTTPGGDEALEQRDRPADVPALGGPVVVVAEQQPACVGVGVARAVEQLQQHRRRHPELRGQLLGLGRHQAVEGLVAPVDRPLGGLLAAVGAALLRVVPDLGERLVVRDVVLGRLDDDVAGGVVAGPPRAPGDLVELARLEVPGGRAVVLGQRGDEHRADGHVDADAEGVGAADDLEQPGLGELLDQPPVLRQHPRVVDADAVPHQARQRRPEPGGEAEVAERLGDAVLVLAAAHVDAHQRLRLLDRRGLRGVDDVHRRLVGLEQLGERLVQRRHGVGEGQRHRPLGAGDDDGLAPAACGQVVAQPVDVAQRGAHQQELRARHLQQRHLPGPAAVGVGVVVELVHDDQADVAA